MQRIKSVQIIENKFFYDNKHLKMNSTAVCKKN